MAQRWNLRKMSTVKSKKRTLDLGRTTPFATRPVDAQSRSVTLDGGDQIDLKGPSI